MKGAVKIINKRMSYGVVISCALQEIHALLPKWIKGFEHAYPVCCHLAMGRLGMLLTDNGRRDGIAYFFESGISTRVQLATSWDALGTSPELKESYQHASHRFVRKDEAVALQAADFLAWEWAKYMDESVMQKKRKMRLSLMALMSKNGNVDERYAGIHATGQPLVKFCKQTRALGLLQREEDLTRTF